MKRILSSSRLLLLKNNGFNKTINSKSLSSSSLLLNRKLSILSPFSSSSLSSSLNSNRLLSKRDYSISNKLNDDVREFQAETRKLLDIVTHSIYTDREVFVRELISNASDALEKFRYRQVKGEVNANDEPLEINILANKDTNTLTLIDNGIGMSKEELIENLGTIARSGSKQFVESLKSTGSTDTNSIIGQFGVGFYSSFMVSDSVTVESISALKTADTNSSTWESDGSGTYKIKESARSDNIKSRGSCIVMKLKESCKEFADADKIKSIIQRYSNFVAFPIKVNGEVVNTVSAIWLNDKNSVTTEQYNNFYKFIANAFDEPRYTLHFRADAPIDLKCLFYVPTFHTEKFGMGRMEPGVNLYSRKVLIESKPKDLLPDWLRFIKGVVDSEDLPLSLSREKPQDSNLLRRIREVLTRKLIRYLEEQMKNDPVKYKEFYIEFNYFLKEGICHDFRFMDQISKLLLFESSSLNEGELTSFDDYIARSTPDEKEIYYLVAPNRDACFKSPYYETFKKHKKEVLFLNSPIDEFVMANLKKYSGRTLISAETSTINLDNNDEVKSDANKDSETDSKLSVTDSDELCGWLSQILDKKTKSIKVTNRLSDSPAIVTDHESGALRRMLKMVDQSGAPKLNDLPPQNLEINPSHPIIISLYSAMKANPENEVNKLIAEQLFDNALVAAGLIDDPRMMLNRLNEILVATLKK